MMAMFFRAFNEEDMYAMYGNGALIEDYCYDKALDRTDADDAWDVIMHVLPETKMSSGVHCPEGFEIGAYLQLPEQVAEIYDTYANLNLTQDDITERLKNLKGDIYRLKAYQKNPKHLFPEFNKLLDFYKQARDNNWGIVFYFN
ncbi:MAG: hypothetical protein CR974_00930 [Gammaproteobacteria bacterium]|nr:MAG: hypothetical protein CR974_00930 [Gammaproteobacteria bacterium]